MKWIAAIALAIGCSLAGQYLSGRIHARVHTLEAVQVMLQAIRAQLEFTAAPVQDLLETLCARSGLAPLSFLIDCCARCRAGEAFPDAWKAALAQQHTNLHQEDVQHLLAFGESFGTTDVAGQLGSCDLYYQLIQANLEQARADDIRYGKLLPGMGMLCGIAGAILLI